MFSFLDKRKLIENAGITEEARAAIQHYVGKYGHNLEDLSKRVREIFPLCQDHFDRLAYLNVITECLGIDINNPKQREDLWNKMREELNPRREYANGWSTGEYDPDLDYLIDYLELLVYNGKKVKKPVAVDLLESRRVAISRTLVYIRVLPPAWTIDKTNKGRVKDLPDAEHFPGELEECWMLLQRHPHYRNPKEPPKKPRHELNQHALDQVRERYGNRIWIEPNDIGTVRSIFEPTLLPTAPFLWFFPYVVFKYSTRCKIVSRSHSSTNPFTYIWNKSAPGHDILWGGGK